MPTKTSTRNAPPARGAPAQRQSGTEVASRRSTAVSNINYGDVGARAGQEDADRDAFAIPFLSILQKLSPQLDRNDEAFIKGVKEGDILNTATQDVYDGEEGILVMHVDYKRSFVAWTVREKGGGFKGEFPPSDPIVMQTTPDIKNRAMLPDGITHLVDTRIHGVILLNGEVPVPCITTFSSTQIKKSKRWMSAMGEVQAKDNKPFFAHVYKLTTVPEKNDKGNWMGWKIEPLGDAQEQEHVDAAIAFYKALRLGSIRMRADTRTEPVDVNE